MSAMVTNGPEGHEEPDEGPVTSGPDTPESRFSTGGENPPGFSSDSVASV
jgi:hypothetical protein